MTDKTPTERLSRLRELLDDRWVEHVDTRLSTLWLEDEEGYLACVDEGDNTDEGLVHLHWWCTPEQAVEATLGRKRDERLAARMTDVMMRVERALGINHGGAEVLSAEVAPLLCEALEIIDAAAATRRGECAFEWSLADNGWADHTCSECGFVENTDVHVKLGWSYCPSCGRRVTDE